MPNVIEITSLDLPELRPYAHLTEAQLRARHDAAQGIFIAEGLTVVNHALDAGLIPLSFLLERRHIEGKARETLARCPEVPVYTADRPLLATLTGFELTRGVLCAMKRPLPDAPARLLSSATRVAVLENIVDPTNVGAIFRSAAALGVDALLLSPSCCDPLHRRSVRVSMGTVFQLPWARMSGTPAQWPVPGFALLKSYGFRTVALALDARAMSIDAPELRAHPKLALLLGNEGDGLSPQTVSACDDCAIIPMAHGVDSLNVAAASAVAFWQLCRKN